jgi:hypothetical protein
MKGMEIDGRRLGEKVPVIPKESIAKMGKSDFDRLVRDLEHEMQAAAKAWDFERAALLRDEIMQLKAGAMPKDEPSERQAEAKGKVEERVGPRKGKGKPKEPIL